MTKTDFMKLYEELSELEDAKVQSSSFDLPDASGIYCIIFEARDDSNNLVIKKYVGQSNHICRRIKEHEIAAQPGGRDYLVYNAMRLYPYKVEVLELCPEEKLNEREIYWIQKLHTYVNDPQAKGYNLTLGGGGTVYYTKEIIYNLLELYTLNNYNHTQTLKDFKQQYANNDHLNKLCSDTLKLIVKANGLPWKNELLKKTVVYAQTTIPDKNDNKKLRYVPNKSSAKYCRICESQEEAELLVKQVGARLFADLGDILDSIKQKHANGKKGTAQAWCVQYLIDNKLYDKYLDLTQYNLDGLALKTRARGRKDFSKPVIHDSCWGALISYFNISTDFKAD